MRQLIFSLTILLIINTNVTAQSKTNTSISGKVVDYTTKQPLEYATVSIISKGTGKTVNGSISDVNGAYIVSNIPYGVYKVEIGFIGYEDNTADGITLSSDKRSVSMGTI